jgi:hypothetical protein
LIVKIQIKRVGRALVEVLERVKVASELTAGLRRLSCLSLIICAFVQQHSAL